MVVNVLWMVGDHPKDSRRLTWGWWVTILGMVGDYPMNAGWPSWGWWATILKIVGGPWEGGWPPMAVDTWSYFCELSLYTNFQICRFWWGFYVAGDMFHELTGICSMSWRGYVPWVDGDLSVVTGGKQSQLLVLGLRLEFDKNWNLSFGRFFKFTKKFHYWLPLS